MTRLTCLGTIPFTYFIDNLLNKIGEKKVDVVCGGPPCQSFSLAGNRTKFDKKDDLFAATPPLEAKKIFSQWL